jgi:TonB-dependent receptor
MNKLWSFILLIALAIIFVPLSTQASSKIVGKVTGKDTGTPLPGANVYLKSTSLGISTDIDGNYTISYVPTGNYTLQVSYIGYKPQSLEIKITQDETLVLDFGLEPMNLEGEEVVVTAQAEGQMQAINQQITSSSIKNIVSSAKIQELPESNAAEAVGRLPGISLEREGGEGNKVVIRGLSPQYNKIEINGISMPATGREAGIGVVNDAYYRPDDRSVDLSMISPNVLEGIEVSKTAMADQEADQLGGTVNFLLRGAPQKPTLNATVQGGYNGLHDKASNYFYILGGGMRFFDNKLGIFAQGNLEKTDRSSNSATAGYQMQADTLTLTNSLNIQDISQTNKRTGGVLVLDYETLSTKIRLSNTLNNIDITKFLKQENFDPVGRAHNWLGNYSDRSLFTMVNVLNLEQSLGAFKLIGSLGYSKSKNDVPQELQMNAYQLNAFPMGWSWNSYPMNPFDIITKATPDISTANVNQFYESSSKTLEEETSGNLSLEGELKTNLADIKLKLGGEYKHKYRTYDYDQSEMPLGWQDMALARLYLSEKFHLTNYDYSTQDFPYAPFIDNNYNAGDFKSGANYTISNVPSQTTMLDVFNELKNLKTVNGMATSKAIWYDYTNSALDDYSGHENYYAAYILPTITFGDKTVTFIPGLRYEHALTEYTANRCNGGTGKATEIFIYNAYTSTKENDYLLPMVHIKYQVFNWFDIRASYTQTLARPDYNRIIPTWDANGSSISWNNVDLKPAQSKNFDFFLSFYTDNLGLLSVGVFQKQIKDFAFATTTWIVDSSYLNPEWPTTVKIGGTASGYINSPDIAKLSGLEAEWQSNFWFLPGVLRGLVLNFNYTYTKSSMKYPEWAPIYVKKKVGPITVNKLVGTQDESYTDRLLDQPTHIFNMTAGFDYAGFSIRGSCQYKSDVFSSSSFYMQLRQTTDPLTLWDVKISQKLPFKGLQVYLNVNNISMAVDQTSNEGTGWFTNRSYYGLSADLGITYILN